MMTSSPGRTPAASSARCSAVVQFDTAHACGAPTNAANSRSNAATSGPCVTQPLRITRRAASASGSPISGLAIGIMRWPPSRLSARHQSHESGQTFVEPDLRAESRAVFSALRVSAKRRGTGLTVALRAVLGSRSRSP